MDWMHVACCSCVSVLLLVGGCDLPVDDPRAYTSRQGTRLLDRECDTNLPRSEASYFPVAEGRTWTYDEQYSYTDTYAYSWAPFTTRITGTLTWEVRNLFVSCDEVTFLIIETLKGTGRDYVPPDPDGRFPGIDSTYAVESKYVAAGAFHGDSLLIDRFSPHPERSDLFYDRRAAEFLGTLKWRYPKDSSDVVTIGWETIVQGFGAVHAVMARLVRDEGVGEWWYSATERNFNSFDEHLVLRR